MKALEVMFVIPSVSIDFIDVMLCDPMEMMKMEKIKNHVPVCSVFCILYISLSYETNIILLCDTFAGEEVEREKRWSLSGRSTHSLFFQSLYKYMTKLINCGLVE